MTGQHEHYGNPRGTPDPGFALHSSIPILCTPLALSDAADAARLYTDVFLADEPTSHRHAPDPARFLPYAQVYVRSLVTKDLSFVTRNTSTGEIAGFIFGFDLADDPATESPTMAEFITHFREAIAMIDLLEERYLDRQTISRGLVFHIFQIGVDRNYRGNGLAKVMILRALSHAKERGFRQAVADCTNPASKRAFEQCGFVEQGALSYEEFMEDGVRFFSGLEGGISLMVRDFSP